MKMQKMTVKVAAFAMAAVLACMVGLLAGCSSGGGNSQAASNATPAENTSAATQAPAGDITVQVTMQQDAVSAEAQDSPDQFAEETINVQAPEGATALEVLQGTNREVETSGSGDSTEVTAIGGLANGDAGAASHWTWTVNGQEQKASPAVVAMADGDTMVWTFVSE